MTLTEKLKEVFTSEDEPEKPAAMSRAVWGKNMVLHRALKALQRSELELTEAERISASAHQALGEIQADGGDSTAAAKAAIKADQAVAAKRAEATVWRQRVKAAKTAVQDAEAEENIEAEERGLLELGRETVSIAATLAALENQINQRLVPCIERAKAASMRNGASVSYLVDLSQGLEFYVLKACGSVIPRGKAHVVLLGEKQYSDLVPDVSTVRMRRTRS